jgi:hypothetical protein
VATNAEGGRKKRHRKSSTIKNRRAIIYSGKTQQVVINPNKVNLLKFSVGDKQRRRYTYSIETKIVEIIINDTPVQIPLAIHHSTNSIWLGKVDLTAAKWIAPKAVLDKMNPTTS